MTKYKVSVIMGVYNSEKILAMCINSILNQTFKNWELIICDDGSIDNTYLVAKEYSLEYDNIKVLKNERNMKLAASLNRCLQVASGEYIARIDADDLCLPERLAKQVAFLDQNSVYDLVGSWAILYDENGEKGIRKTKELPDKLSMRFGSPFIHPSIMMRKKVYESLGGYTVKKRTEKGQDTDLWFRFFNAGNKAYNIQEPLIKYHESLEDYSKYNIRSAFDRVKNHYYGFKLLGFPKRDYIFLLKPIISAIIPRRIRHWHHSKK